MNNYNGTREKAIENMAKTGKRLGVFSKEFAEANLKLSKADPQLIFKLMCRQLAEGDYAELWTKKPQVMNLLAEVNKPLAMFISRAKTILSAKMNNDKFDRAPVETTSEVETKRLIDYALLDELITNDEADLYKDLLEWDASKNSPLIELDILKKCQDYTYNRLRVEAPQVLFFIKEFYPNWYAGLMNNEQNRISKQQ